MATIGLRGGDGADLRFSMNLDPAKDCAFPPRVFEAVPPAAQRTVEVEGRDSAGQVVFWGALTSSDPGSGDHQLLLTRRLLPGTVLLAVPATFKWYGADEVVRSVAVGPKEPIIPVRVGSVEQRAYLSTERLNGIGWVCASVSGLGTSDPVCAWAFSDGASKEAVLGKVSADGYLHPNGATFFTVIPPEGPSPCHPAP